MVIDPNEVEAPVVVTGFSLVVVAVVGNDVLDVIPNDGKGLILNGLLAGTGFSLLEDVIIGDVIDATPNFG